MRRTATESTRITPTAEEAFPASIVTDEPNKQVAYPASSKTSLLPPIAFGEAGEDLKYHPAVFIGVGGTGAAVLRSLRSRLCQRFGNVDDIPSLQMLLLDTDVTALHNATRGERSSALRPNQLLPLTLKQPQEYRGEATSLLEWLNRRWLFNIPRSLTTEGIRALGRLALVDHFDAIANVLHHALSSVIDDNSIDSSTRTTGLRFVKARHAFSSSHRPPAELVAAWC